MESRGPKATIIDISVRERGTDTLYEGERQGTWALVYYLCMCRLRLTRLAVQAKAG